MEPVFNTHKCHARLLTNRQKQCSRNNLPNCMFCKTHKRMWMNKGVYLMNGNPNVLVKFKPRIINYQKEYNYSYIRDIQKTFRRFMVKNNIAKRGICVYARHKCNNVVDCMELENIDSIPNHLFFSYKDDANIYWGFHITTFQNLIKYSTGNPYTFKDINDSIKEKFNMNKGKITRIKLKLEPRNKKTIELQQKCINIFQKIDKLGPYTKCEWFLHLNSRKLKDLYYFLQDMWDYRLNLTIEDKKKYIDTEHKLFVINFKDIRKYTDYYKIADIILGIFNRFLTEGKYKSDKSTAANWILSVLTLVNLDARIAYPWLYQAAYPH